MRRAPGPRAVRSPSGIHFDTNSATLTATLGYRVAKVVPVFFPQFARYPRMLTRRQGVGRKILPSREPLLTCSNRHAPGSKEASPLRLLQFPHASRWVRQSASGQHDAGSLGRYLRATRVRGAGARSSFDDPTSAARIRSSASLINSRIVFSAAAASPLTMASATRLWSPTSARRTPL